MNERHAPELDDDYYIVNFHTISGFVVDTYKDLLNDEELQWFTTVGSTTKQSQSLYIRLLTRRGSTFRLNRLNYSEIDNIGAAAMELSCCGLASLRAPDDWTTLLSCFTKPQLLDLLDLHTLRKLSRVDLTTHITQCDDEIQRQYQQRLQSSDQWITLHGHTHWMLMQLCFFGNLYQDSSELVRRQLGTLTYEDYPLDLNARAFRSREQIDAHWRYFECETLFDCADLGDACALLNLADSLPALPQSCVNDVSLKRRLDRFNNRIARQLERLSYTDEAIGLYEKSVHPPARERRVRIMMARGQWESASVLAGQMVDMPCNESEKMTGLKLLAQCNKAQGVAQTRQRPFKPVASKLVLRNDGLRVEEIARRFFERRGQCFYTENALVNGVLGLFIWDIIFHPVPGVFYNPYQVAPADFNDPEFCIRRADLLRIRFAELDDRSKLATRVLEAYKLNFGKVNPLVHWNRLSPQILELAVDRIAPGHWRALFERILADTREHTSGFPDLVFFPESKGYEFIEIKGPGDTLQANQRRWMQYFDQYGIACRLVHVRYRSDEPAPDNLDQAAT